MAHALHIVANIMMKNSSLPMTLLFAIGASAGCATDPAPGDLDDDIGDGSGSDGAGPVPLTAEGKYALKSEYDIATNMPGKAGAVINSIIDATDSPDDPTHWILDQLVAQLPDGSVKNNVQGAIPFVAGYLNDRLLEVAPNFVTKIVDLGDKFGQAARKFGTLDTLEVAADGTATHVVTGINFKVDELELAYLFTDYGMTDLSAPVTVGLDKYGKLTVSDHKVPLSYGKVMRLALDEVIIPLIDPTAVDLEDLLKGVVNCQAVGRYVYEAVDMGSASTFESACNTGLKMGAQALYTKISQVDGAALEFSITGTARGIDRNKDGNMDIIQTGAWAGMLSYSGEGSPLASATFTGERM